MLRRKPTAIALTSEDIAAYEDSLMQRGSENDKPHSADTPTRRGPEKGDGKIDPNDELRPLPGDRARVVRNGISGSAGAAGTTSRAERIMGR